MLSVVAWATRFRRTTWRSGQPAPKRWTGLASLQVDGWREFAKIDLVSFHRYWLETQAFALGAALADLVITGGWSMCPEPS